MITMIMFVKKVDFIKCYQLSTCCFVSHVNMFK